MKLLEYLYYRMYKAYNEKNDSPIFRTFMYITMVEYFLLGSLLIFTERILIFVGFLAKEGFQEMYKSKVFWGGNILVIFIFTYLYLFRKDFSYYEKKFSNYHSSNKNIKIWMLAAFPFVVFFSSFIICIVLFGGNILNTEITGLFK